MDPDEGVVPVELSDDGVEPVLPEEGVVLPGVVGVPEPLDEQKSEHHPYAPEVHQDLPGVALHSLSVLIGHVMEPLAHQPFVASVLHHRPACAEQADSVMAGHV